MMNGLICLAFHFFEKRLNKKNRFEYMNPNRIVYFAPFQLFSVFFYTQKFISNEITSRLITRFANIYLISMTWNQKTAYLFIYKQ